MPHGFAQCFKCYIALLKIYLCWVLGCRQHPGGSALFWNTFPVSATPCPSSLRSGKVQAGTLGMSEQAVHQHAHAALLHCHALCRHFPASSSCFSLNLLEIAKEHASVFAYIESLDDTDLCYLSLPGPFQEQRCSSLLYRGTCFCLLQPFLNGEWRANECGGVCVCVSKLYKSPHRHPFGNLFYEIFISMFSNVHVLRNNKQHRENI